MKYIVVSFTLKGQNFDDIIPALEDIKAKNPDATLVHGFMPLEVVKEKGYSTDVVDKLNELFPEQKSFYNNESGPDRTGMKKFSYDNQATVYVIGKIVEGVKDEVMGYIKSNIKLVFYNLGEDGTEKTYSSAQVLSFANNAIEQFAKTVPGDTKPTPVAVAPEYLTSWTEINSPKKTTMKKAEEKTDDTARSDAKGNTTDQKEGPVNPTNPNALENQPGGNGNARSLLHDTTNTERDSNEAGGTKTVEQQVTQEPSLASSPEAIKTAEANKNSGTSNAGNSNTGTSNS